MGYPEGKEPHYFWSHEQLGGGTLVYVEVAVPAGVITPTGAARLSSPRAVLLLRVPAGLLLQGCGS